MVFWKNNTIWFDELPNGLFRSIDLKEEQITDISHLEIEYLSLWHHKSTEKGNFVSLPEELLYLELNRSNIHNFIGIEKLTKLKRLELHYCTKLQSDTGLSKVAHTLEHLHIANSKKFIPHEEMFSLQNLKVLCLNSCGNLESLSFLKYFPNLIDFRYVDTNIIDGDLSPIIEHPKIRSVGFLNKRHYNISEIEMDARLNSKDEGAEFKTTVKKESDASFQTFRYS